jgi:hypothetical protein
MRRRAALVALAPAARADHEAKSRLIRELGWVPQ